MRVRKLFGLFILLGFLVFPFKASAFQQPIKQMGYDFCYTGYKYSKPGQIYADVNLPYTTGDGLNLYQQKNVYGKIIPVSDEAGKNQVSIATMKKGTSSRTNYMYVVEVGNAGVLEAAKNGEINKIHFIEVTKERLYVPMIFIPIYFDRFITTVYGE